jgi:ABC-2 type transport system ATP-binding protein
MTAIEVSHLVKRYRGTGGKAVDDASFAAADGEFFCLLGPNGAGKTTTFAVLNTTLAPTSGLVRVAGCDIRGARARVRREIGVVFQGPALDTNLTAEENVRLHAVLYGLYPWRPTYRLMPAGYHRQVGELAGLLGLDDDLGRKVRHLSGGTRRKLEIVRALLHRPRVLFLDEPTAGLDPQSRRSLWAHLEGARRQHGTTVFATTHYLEEAGSADTVCVMAGGRVVALGSPARLRARPPQEETSLAGAARERPAPAGATLEDVYLRLVAEAAS